MQHFAECLVDHTRKSLELEIILNYDPDGGAYQPGERMHFERLKQAIRYRQKEVSRADIRCRQKEVS